MPVCVSFGRLRNICGRSFPARKARFVAALGLFCVYAGAAQTDEPAKRSFGAGAAVLTASSGYGLRLEANLYYATQKNAYRLGVLFQPERTTFSGVSARWNHTFVHRDHKHKLELLSFLDLVYNWKIHVSGRVLAREAMVNPLKGFNARDYAFTSIEVAGGGCLNWFITERLQWLNAIGLGFYHTLNYPGNMYYDPAGLGPYIRTEVIVMISP